MRRLAVADGVIDVDGRQHDGQQIGRLHVQPELSRHDPRDVEDVVDHRGLRRRVALDDVQRACDHLRVAAPCAS